MNRIILFLFGWVVMSCASNDISERVSCATSGLSLSVAAVIDATSCKAIDGQVTVTATGGEGPYDFSLNNGTFQTNPSFANLGPGTYVIKVKDFNGCETTAEAVVSAPNSNLAASLVSSVADSECSSDNGSLVLSATGGAAPYQFKLPGGNFSSNTTYTNLKHGQYAVIVKDDNDCQVTVAFTVPRGNTGIKYSTAILPIFTSTCNFSGCHGSGTGSRDWTNFTNVKREAANIKTRTGNGSMPIGSGRRLTPQEIEAIACWVDDGALDN
jgi:hypothetical protein